ncbi:MAG: hypothetical protein JWO46_2854 [Nocardioidaceae bacterium]|nr:hypothetical protein [Nocardioidaceae bacterium]
MSAPGTGDDRPPKERPDAGAHLDHPASLRQRLLDGLRHPSRGQLVGGFLLAVLGFATVAQVQSTDDDDTYAGLRSADLVQLLNGLNAQSRRAETEIASLEKTRSQLTDRTQRRQAALTQAKSEAATLGILAGTLPATGPGLRITVTDPDDRVSLNNLLDGVEELRAAGAEAMEFNDSVRVVAQTSFEDADGGLLVDGQRVTAPYVIDVIGPPTTLADTLDFVEGFAYDVKANGGDVKVKKLDKVKITSVTARDSAEFAEGDTQ